MRMVKGWLVLFLVCLAVSSSFAACLNRRIVLYNRSARAIEVYRLSDLGRSLRDADRVWQSPPFDGGSEVKPVRYQGGKALLATTRYGVVIFSYPDRTVLFHREITGYAAMNIHSALPMDDGNVLIADSAGYVGILYPGQSTDDVDQPSAQTQWYPLSYAHGLAYDPIYQAVYAGGYVTLHRYRYGGSGSGAVLSLMSAYDLSAYYRRCAVFGICQEDADWEDGVHDVYPVEGDNPHLFFLTTGERVFLFDASQQRDNDRPSGGLIKIALTEYAPFYRLDSQYSRQERAASLRDRVVLKKGGVKAISGAISGDAACVLARPAPFFTPDLQYDYYEPRLLYAESLADTADVDLTDQHHLQFDRGLAIAFYKARLLPDDF
ncbi:hypothetical protein [Paludibacterium sp.]|uniref:hypothetical protein n=1 Tax=Paludibacterium sp. TaxID=1917523 RepID=UPI0025F8AB5E|nr:hypothetical protein [Paludibacterium sp.]MBV8649552.1 hypothetical protein [Paludibacterium sp.]